MPASPESPATKDSSAFFWPGIIAGLGVLFALGAWYVIRQQTIVATSHHGLNQPWLIVAILLVTFLLAGFIYCLTSSRNRALELVHQKTEELARAIQHAESATEAKGRFLANMSHEIRTPMNAIIGMGELLKESPLSSEQRHYVETLSKAGDQLLSLINDILDISRIESGSVKIDAHQFDLRLMIEEVCDLIALSAHKQGIELSNRIAPNAPQFVIGDESRLRQILINLLGNAVKFTHRGEVVLNVEVLLQDDRSIQFEFKVRDTGIGISEDQLKNIFSRFAQADNSTTKRYGGSGLGLAISQQLTKLMGGSIGVESIQGKGSCFTVVISLLKASATAQSTTIHPPALDGKRVLIVDDNETNRLIMREAFQMWNATIAEAIDGNSALEQVKHAHEIHKPFHLVLLDYQMPGLNGLQTAQRILNSPGLEKTVVMMLTSGNVQGDAQTCRQLGIKAFLVKPVKRAELYKAISIVLSQGNSASSSTNDAESSEAPLRHKQILPCKLLLVDDSEENLNIVQAYLRDHPFKITTACNGLEAVSFFKKEKFDLVLIDIQMPEMDGFTATAEIRSWERQRKTAPIPIVALTAYARVEERARCLAAGCDDHLAKPIRKEPLVSLLMKYAPTIIVDKLPSLENKQPTVRNELQELIPSFFSARKKDLLTLKAAINIQDFPGIELVGHKLRGVAALFGYPELSEIGSTIEIAAINKNIQIIEEQRQAFEKIIDQADNAQAGSATTTG